MTTTSSAMRMVLTILLLFSVAAHAQYTLSPIYEITSDIIDYQNIPDQYVQLLSDEKGAWTFEQVRTSPLTNQFVPTPLNYNYYSAHTHWQRLRLHNALKKEAKIGFFNYQQRVDYYIGHTDDRWEHFQSGWSVPWSKGDGLKKTTRSFIPIVLKPDETAMVFRRTYNSYRIPYFTSAIIVGTTDKVVQDSYIDDEPEFIAAIRNSFNFGFCLFAALFSLFFFFIVWERVYLYFAIYVSTMGLGRFDVELFVLFLKEHPVFWSFIFPFGVWRVSTFFLVQFIRHLLKTYQYVPRLDTFLFLLNFLPIATGLCALIFPPTSKSMWEVQEGLRTVDGPVVIITALITFFLVLKQQRWSNKLLTFAIFPAFVVWGVLISIYRIYIDIPQVIFNISLDAFGSWLQQWWNPIETVCLGWQVVFFSWLLLQRFSTQRRQLAQLALEKERERRQLIEQQKQELEKQVEQRTAELKHSLQELKATQAQLIQSEKMASLGELTAGIAHEIQNPLNFVNNFSESNIELLRELEQENDNGGKTEVRAITQDVIQNELKILHHGKRAEAIVKSMLEHSRTSTGEKQLTNINTLADEYLRLAYHGFRAKDKTFNAEIETSFDKNIGKIDIVPQDIGRVLLNLFNNAFYAVAEKKKQGIEGYEPIISLSTKKANDTIEISVQDNGMGILKNLQDKIFQPFFTTKPTGEGTGLGLSLSYDIVKAQGGELKVTSKEGAGATFIILMPVHKEA